MGTERTKNNFRIFGPLTLPSPTRGEGRVEKLFFVRSEGAFEEDRLGRTRLSFPKTCSQEDLERGLS